jgi:hypothetical protein
LPLEPTDVPFDHAVTMSPRRLAVLAVAFAAAAAAPSADAGLLVPLPACGGPTTTNCVVSVTRNSVAQPYPSTGGDPYQITVASVPPPDPGELPSNEDLYLSADRTAGGWTLDSSDVWVFTINTGSLAPLTTFSRGRNVEVTRGGTAASHTLRVELQPVRMAYGACNSSGGCPGLPSTLAPGYLDGWINDLSYVTDPDYAAAQRGFDLATNADWASTPPQLDFETNSIVLDVANAHFEPDGTTVFVGEAEFRLPNAMLRGLYNVDDPASLTASAFRVSTGSGPAPTITVAVGTGEVNVRIENITFSKRKLKITGDTRPRAPRTVRARRTGRTTATVRFLKALPRGSKVRGYVATCSSSGRVVRKSALASPIRMTGLSSSLWRCNVRAKSRAGLGRWASFRIPAR